MKILSILVVTIFLQGCAGGMLSGNYERTVATNPVTGELLTSSVLNRPLYNLKREARSVSMVRNAGESIAGKAGDGPTNSCGAMLAAEVLEQIGSNASAEYFRGYFQCQNMAMMGNIVAYSTGAPTTEAGQVMRETTKAVKYAEDGMTARIVQPFREVSSIGKVGLVVGGYTKQSSHRRDENVAAVQNAGDITATINTDNSNYIGQSSNDPVSGGSPELAGGTASSTVSNEISSSPETNVVLGSRNDFIQSDTSDSARSFIGSDGNPFAEPSATQNNNQEGRQVGGVTSDEFTGDSTASDDDGSL